MKFYCASDATIKNVKIAEKTLFSKTVFNKIVIFSKSIDFLDSDSSSRH